MSKNPVLHGKSKHIKVKYYAIREAVSNKEIQVEYCRSEDQLADFMTKGLHKCWFEMLREIFGVLKKNSKEEC